MKWTEPQCNIPPNKWLLSWRGHQHTGIQNTTYAGDQQRCSFQQSRKHEGGNKSGSSVISWVLTNYVVISPVTMSHVGPNSHEQVDKTQSSTIGQCPLYSVLRQPHKNQYYKCPICHCGKLYYYIILLSDSSKNIFITVHPKRKFCHYLFTIMSFQTCMTLFLL